LDDYPVEVRSSLAERAEAREQLGWLLKDLGNLPERQRAVLVMRELSGLDFVQIGAALGTSGAVVRQSLYEARRSLQRMDFGRNLKCEVVTRAISDADGRVTRRKDIRAHLRACSGCRKFEDTIRAREKALAAISPIPAAVTGGLLQAASGGFAGAGSGGLTAAAGFGAAKSVGASGILKLAATAAAVAAVGTASVDGTVEAVAPKAPPLETHSAQPRVPSAAPSLGLRGDAALSESTSRLASRESASPPPQASIDRSRSLGAAPGAETPGGAQPSPARPEIAVAPGSGESRDYVNGGESKPHPDQRANPGTGSERSSKPTSDDPSQSAESAKPAGNANPPGHAAHPAHPIKAAATGNSGTTGQGEGAEPKPKPEHPPHPEQSQKPAASGEPSSAPEEAPPSVSPYPPGDESAAPNGWAKGREKHSEP